MDILLYIQYPTLHITWLIQYSIKTQKLSKNQSRTQITEAAGSKSGLE